MQKRKISFNWLHLSSMVENEEEFTNVESNLLALLSYISALPKIQRKYNLTKDKFSPAKVSVLKKTLNALNYYLKAPNIVIVHRFLIKTQLKQERIQNG
jgi:hypothetical protein